MFDLQLTSIEANSLADQTVLLSQGVPSQARPASYYLDSLHI
jgi:hypothetical protein